MPERLMRLVDVPWLTQVPSDWEVRRLRTLADIRTGARDTQDRKDNGLYPFYVRSQKVERIDSWSYAGEAVLTAGDGAGVGKVFHYAKGKFDFHQRAYSFTNFREILGRYFFYYFSTHLSYETSAGTAKSTVDSLRRPMLQNFPVPIPTQREQELIVRYLDHAELRIAKAIAAKTELAMLLQQQRLALLCSEVLGRDLEADLDRNHQNLSESRVLDWVGPVPNNWDVVPVNGIFDAVKRKNVGLIENQVLSLSYGRVIIKPREKLRGLVPESFETYQVVEPGDVIVRPTDLQNDTTSLRVGQVQDRGIITSAYIAIRPKASVNPDFVMMQLAAYDFLKVLYGYGSGLRQNLDFKHLKHVPMMLPNNSEQSMIVERVRSKTGYVESAQQSVAREIALLKEYRTRLISDVVTGKLDVRAEAAKLPVIDPEELAEVTAGAGLTAEDDGDDE